MLCLQIPYCAVRYTPTYVRQRRAPHLSQFHVVPYVSLINELEEPLLRVKMRELPRLRSVRSHKEAMRPISLRWKQRGRGTPG